MKARAVTGYETGRISLENKRGSQAGLWASGGRELPAVGSAVYDHLQRYAPEPPR